MLDFIVAFVIVAASLAGGVLWCLYIARCTSFGRKLTLREWIGDD